MVEWPMVTKAFLIIVLFAVVIFDVVAIWFGGREASISFVLSNFVKNNPIIAIAIGIVIGHLFWPV